MKRICGWCKKDLGEKEPLEDKAISHGMCEDCEKKILKEEEDKKNARKKKEEESNKNAP